MIFILDKWRIKSDEHGGFLAQKKVGSQWKETSYFDSLGHAARYVLGQRLHDKTIDLVIDASDAALLAVAQSKLLRAIETTKLEIMTVLNHGK